MAVIVLYVPSTIIGGFLILRCPSFMRNDLEMVTAEIREELDEHDRRSGRPRNVPALQVRQVDFSYGQVQILFDVGST